MSAGRLDANVIGIGAAGLMLLLGLGGRGDAIRAILASTLATGWGLALVFALGQQLSPLTVALGCLTAAVGGEFTVLLAQAQRQRSTALRRSVRIAALASGAGFLVLLGSNLVIMRQFSVYIAGAVLFSYPAASAVVRLWPIKSVTVDSTLTSAGGALIGSRR